MRHSLYVEQLENNGIIQFQDELDSIGIVAPTISDVHYDQDTMDWLFTLIDGSMAWGVSPELAAMDWLHANFDADTLNDRVLQVSGLGFQDYYTLILRTVSGEYAA